MKLRDKNKCTGCEACINSCPRKCISLQRADDGFYYPVVDEHLCVNCKKCETVCANISAAKKNKCKSAYIGYSNNYQMSGSSGGVIGEFAKYILKDGVVYGAAFDNDFSVEHIRVEFAEGLPKIFKSKYTQSRIGDSFTKVKVDLENKKQVLFTGTSCQIAGLKAFLGKEYENLVTVEMICHGVPSPTVWQVYLKEKNEDKTIENIDFRDKKISWNQFSLSIKYKEGFDYSSVAGKDDYMKRFLGNYILRNSCYKCEFRGDVRVADITVGDAWCAEDVLSRLSEYQKGTSSILINTEKGMKLLNSIQNEIQVCKVVASEALGYNNSYFISPFRPSFRKKLKYNMVIDDISETHSPKDKICYLLYRIKAKMMCLVFKFRMDKNEKNLGNN